MVVHLHRASSPDVLVDGLAAMLEVPQSDPFAEEVVAVPTRGVERWLAQRLSHRLGASEGRTDGVTAGVRFLSPHSLVALVLGVEASDPWQPERLAWPVLRAIDECIAESWAAPLARHLGGDAGREDENEEYVHLRRGRRYAVARRIASAFSSYHLQRPAMMRDWRKGGASDGLDGRVDDDHAWQPHLWREVVERVDADPPDVRHALVVERLRSGGAGLELPGRLSLFGATRLARSEVEVLDALGAVRHVHLWLPQASPGAWATLAHLSSDGPVPRSEDMSARVVRHPLLVGLGRDSRELQRTLALADTRDDDLDASPAPITVSEMEPPSLLSLLQSDLRLDRPPPPGVAATRLAAPDDASIQVHACHGRARQVEVLREVLTGLFERDATLEARDVLVMCPDVDAFAPLLHAGFGLGDIGDGRTPAVHPAHRFRMHVADRAPVHTNELLALARDLVGLADSRLRAGEVLDLIRSAPVRRRFHFDDDDLDAITFWVKAAVVRWGLDGVHRDEYRLPGLTQNTWLEGVARVLVGATVDGDVQVVVGDVLAATDVDSGSLDLAGRLAELVHRFHQAREALHSAGTAAEWMSALREAVHSLGTPAPREDWQAAQLDRELEAVGAQASAAGGEERLALSDVREMLAERLAGRPTRSSFRTGTLTVCGLMPMRSVPHRVVCLLGIDDGTFPRQPVVEGDDVLARRPVTGERDRRSEDRQLLLDALMSAEQTLVVIYSGADERTGAARPPAVPVSELLDAVTLTAGEVARDHVLHTHPLQAFDARNFRAASPGGTAPTRPGMPFSFDRSALAGARAAAGPRVPVRPFDLDLGPRREGADDALDLADLIGFYRAPLKTFVTDRLGVSLPRAPEDDDESIPLTLPALGQWAVGDRLLRNIMLGVPLEEAKHLERLRGVLPPGQLGEPDLNEIAEGAVAVAAAARAAAGVDDPSKAVTRSLMDVEVVLGGGRLLTGTVSGVADRIALSETYSSAKAKDRLTGWLNHLALSASGRPELSVVVVGRRKGGAAQRYTYAGVPEDEAREILTRLVAVRDRGMEEPLALSPDVCEAWVTKWRASEDEEAAISSASAKWSSDFGDQNNANTVLLHGRGRPLADLLGRAEADLPYPDGVTSRLGQLALLVWGPLLEHEDCVVIKP